MITEDDLMQALVADINKLEMLQPGDVTMKRLAAASGRDYKMIDRLLREKVRAGELVVVKKFDAEACRNVNVYIRPA